MSSKIEFRNVYKTLAFFLFTAVSAFFSVNLFVNLGSTLFHKTIMGIGAVAIDSLKAVLTMNLSYLMTRVVHYFRRRKKEELYNLLYGSYVKKLISTGLIYFLVLIVAVGGSLGYGLTQVYRYSQTNAVVDTTIETSLYDSNIASYDAEITSLNIEIDGLKVDKEGVRVLNDALDPTKGGDRWTSLNTYIPRMNAIQAQIDTKNARITELRGLIREEQAKKLASQTNKVEEEATTDKSMFDIVSMATGAKPSTLMFILVFVFALVVEVGQLTTSPHKETVDEEKDIDEFDVGGKIKRKMSSRPKTRPQVPNIILTEADREVVEHSIVEVEIKQKEEEKLALEEAEKERQKKLEEERQKKIEEERASVQEAMRIAEEVRQQAIYEEKKRRREEDERKRLIEEEKKKQRELEEKERRALEEERKRLAEQEKRIAEENRLKAIEEEKRRKENERRRVIEAQKKMEEDRQKKREEEEKRKRSMKEKIVVDSKEENLKNSETIIPIEDDGTEDLYYIEEMKAVVDHEERKSAKELLEETLDKKPKIANNKKIKELVDGV